MQKTIFKTAILMLIVIFICQPLQLKADGGMIPYQWDDKDIYEPSQTSLIVYENGKEDLYLKVNYEGETNKFVWVIPTPSYPEASKAPKNIFTELSIITGEEMQEVGLQNKGIDTFEAEDSNVIVHSQKNIGIYEITVLSASGTDGLFDWLNNNDYKVDEEAKELLDWYIQKEWYFTAMKIKPENLLEKSVKEFKKIDDTVTEENFSTKFTDYYINSIINSDYEKFKNMINILELATRLNIIGYSEISIDDFKILSESTNEEGLINEKKEIKGEIDEILLELNFDKVNKYSDYIEPIKISFKTNTIVYPLKISQMSTRVPEDPSESSKTNEILLYILTDNQMMAPGFINEYAEIINSEKLIKIEEEVYDGDLEGLKEIVGNNEYFLTKIRRDFAKVEMDEDLYLVVGDESDTTLINYNLARERDQKRISHIKQMQVALELYYNDHNAYVNNIDLDNGIKSEDFNTTYMRIIPINPEPGGIDYDYKFLNEGQEYLLHFELEVGYGNHGSGQCVASPNGMECKGEIKQEPIITLSQSYSENEKYQQAKNQISGSAMADRLKGKIVLKVEDDGKAYYINSNTKTIHYLGRPDDAFSVMRDQGIGITNANLSKMQIGLSNLTGADSDGDGLPDMFEDAIGTDKNKADTDGDGYNDKAELEGNYNPNGAGKLNSDNNFANNQKGKIFLQVENNGEAWYMNPEDGKRYFLGRPADAFQVMKNLGLGISNNDFEKL